TKTDVLKYILQKIDIDDLSKAVLIGDRKHDIIGAKEVGIKCISILYGYGSKEEFVQYNADYIVDTVENLERFLVN
ncbi:MAG: HAD hydrolase-like protein, partial [Clostridia bacterium]|nr:HAD hydrolase-like protein [Clostridia bacterium]